MEMKVVLSSARDAALKTHKWRLKFDVDNALRRVPRAWDMVNTALQVGA